MKINASQQSEKQSSSKGGTKKQSPIPQHLQNNRQQTSSRKSVIQTVLLNNSQRQMQILLSIIIVVLSTLWVQITMQRNAPFIRTAQSYFNEIVLQHYSQDIYEGKDVIYWKTAERYKYQDILDVFRRLNKTVYELDTNSLFDILHSNQAEFQVEILAKYGVPNQNTINNITSNHTTLSNLSNLFLGTVMNRSYYQYLWQLQISIQIPIIYRQARSFLNIKMQSQVYSSLTMGFYLNVDIIGRNDNLVKGQFDKDKLGVRKLHDSFDIELSIPYIFWIIVLNYVALLALQLKFIVKKNREVSRLLRLKIKQQRRIQQLLQDVSISSQNFSKGNINESDDGEQQIDLTNEHFQIPQKYKLPIIKRIKKIGIYHIIQFLISFISLITCYKSNNGLICFFAWIKLMVYLTQTKNKYMFGFLFEETIPIYLKILLNISLLISAFVLFNSLVFPTTVKFQTLKLGFFQYIFNYFQYGIYQNFILAFQQYGLLAQFFYFLQLIYLLYIGNNILQSVLANQVMKNSYIETVKEMIQELKTDCPACGADPKSQVKSSEEFIGEISKEHPHFFSKIIKNDGLQIRPVLESQIQKDQYNIVVDSPQLSPFFPSKVQRKTSQEFVSPKLKNGNFQKKMKQINKKMEQQAINLSKIQELNQFNNKYQGSKSSKKFKLQISQSKIQQGQQSKYHKRIKSKIELLFKKVTKFNQFKYQSPNHPYNTYRIKQSKKQILKKLLQTIEGINQKISEEIQ